uniref:type II 3-dehydroquinate dehydratase n=1 Tax=Pyxidicoccus xibeiensis TaxID=2906759 RepID=UPI00389A942B
MKLLVLHGPNLNLLGVREGTSGGRLSDLDAALKERAEELGLELKISQSNHEGVLLDTLAAEREAVDGILINPAGLFASYPLKEALEAVGLPAIEVLLKPPARESIVGEACVLQVHGTQSGFEPYLQALDTFASGVFTPGKPESPKTLGRKKDREKEEAPAPSKIAPLALVKSGGKARDKDIEPARALARAAEALVPTKTLGRKTTSAKEEASEAARPGKTLGRGAKTPAPTADLLTRAVVRRKISDRLAGKLTPAELASWARTQWQAVQRGAPAESGHRDLLEETLQNLTLSTLPATKLSDEQLVDMLTRLDE